MFQAGTGAGFGCSESLSKLESLASFRTSELSHVKQEPSVKKLPVLENDPAHPETHAGVPCSCGGCR
jgi:hypothetical protein